MDSGSEYVLGQSAQAARRLEIQDAHMGEASERFLDLLKLRPNDRVVELGCGPGGLSRRILRRLGPDGVLVIVDQSDGLLQEARQSLEGHGPARFETRHDNVSVLGEWLQGANVVAGRSVLHHIPMAEFLVGRLRAAVSPGTRVGFLEPDFRAPLGWLAYLNSGGRDDVTPLQVWARAINELYLARRISPDVGASLARTMAIAGYRDIAAHWSECRSDAMMLENMQMFYDEVREPLQSLQILTGTQIDEQQRLLRGLEPGNLPAAWATHAVVGVA